MCIRDRQSHLRMPNSLFQYVQVRLLSDKYLRLLVFSIMGKTTKTPITQYFLFSKVTIVHPSFNKS